MKNDQIFTPNYIVNKMLNDIGFQGDGIDKRTIFEPSFGDGAFLVEITQRIINRYRNQGTECIKNALSMVYGIEISETNYAVAVSRLNRILDEVGIHDYHWDNLMLGDALEYESKTDFDYIIGNPPYIRLHHLDEKMREKLNNFRFGVGTTDMYVLFFEKCIRLLGSSGRLCFITPNSYFHNASQGKFRQYLTESGMLKSLWDYGRVKVFAAGTYTAVALLDAGGNNGIIRYAFMNEDNSERYHVNCNAADYMGKEPWCFNNDEDSAFLRSNKLLPCKLGDICMVQNGIATNADSIYVVSKETVDMYGLELVRPTVKASTLRRDMFIIFPYKWDDKDGMYKIIPEKEMQNTYPNTYAYLLSHREKLDARDMDGHGSEWYRYARSQGIQASHSIKIALKHFISAEKGHNAEWILCGEDVAVYSGIFIVPADENISRVMSILNSRKFGTYLSLSGKDVSGGYKTVNTKIVKSYGIE